MKIRDPSGPSPPHALSEIRKEVPTPPSLPAEDPDSRARAEAEQQDLEKARNEHKRDEVTRRIIGWGMWILVVITLAVVTGAVFTLGYHMLVPTKYHWLSTNELQDVKDFILSGAVVGLGTHYIRRFLEPRQRSLQ